MELQKQSLFDDNAPQSICRVIVTAPIDRPLDYSYEDPDLTMGSYVIVPLGPRKVLGVVWQAGLPYGSNHKLKPISRRLDLPPMHKNMMQFLEWMADYTLTPLSGAVRLATRVPELGKPPPRTHMVKAVTDYAGKLTPKRQTIFDWLTTHAPDGVTIAEAAASAGAGNSVVKTMIEIGALEGFDIIRHTPYPRLDPDMPGRALTQSQADAAKDIAAATKPVLLKGVTGSGKTEVYFEAIANAMRENRQSLVMIPEIALTQSFLKRFEDRFGGAPGAWHSGLGMSERRRLWHAVATGEVQVVVGARSALFLPFSDLGLIVVDEEHDGAYKQEEGAIYHGRDMAVVRAAFENATVVLASATPALESMANARAGKYALVEMNERFGPNTLPQMRTIDLRKNAPDKGTWIAPELLANIKARAEKGEQSLLFLNRRGYAPLTICRSCGHQIGCHECDARMVEHRFLDKLMCHQCGAERPIPTECPECHAEDALNAIGPGVERLAEEVTRALPDLRLSVLSSDITGGADALRQKIDEVARGDVDVIIGTQLVAKGHNFPNLTLVGVIDADIGLEGGDLRAAEKSFQLIRQVAGRAGRADRPGEAIIQSYQPDHPVLQAILSPEDNPFYDNEIAGRKLAAAPPYSRYIGVIISAPDEAEAMDTGRALLAQAKPLVAAGARILGPAPAPIARIRGRARVRLLVKAPRALKVQPLLKTWRDSIKTSTRIRITLDIDPQSFY